MNDKLRRPVSRRDIYEKRNFCRYRRKLIGSRGYSHPPIVKILLFNKNSI